MGTRNGRTVRWMVIAIGGVVVLVPVTLFLVLVLSLGFAGTGPTVGGAQTAALSYYRAVQQHDYPSAYADLAPHATTMVDGQYRVVDSVDTLASIAQAADRNDGVVTAYTATDGQFEQGTTIADLTVRVTRGTGAHDVHVRIGYSGGTWKILRTDRV